MIFCTSSFIQQNIIYSLLIRLIVWLYLILYKQFLQRRMVVNKYSHAFTKVQLQLIIDDYLAMAPYYTILHQKIKQYVRRIQEDWRLSHSNDKPHPIRIYTKDYFSKNLQEGDSADLHIDMRTTYSSAVPKYYYIYPLQVIVEILESQSFYKDLPKNIIINHLLTTENIQIIIETLTIISQEMSKKIKTTLASKDVRRTEVVYKEKMEQPKEEEDFFQVELPVIHEEGEFTVPQSRVDILQDNLFEEDQHQTARKKWKKHTYNPMIRTDMPKGVIEAKIEKTIEVQKTCTFCQNYLTYLSESNGESYGDDTLNKLSKESIRYLKIIAQSVTYFTLYLVQNNLTEIPNDIHVLNRVLNTIGIVITQDIFNSQLNPKNIQPKQKYVPKPKNLIDHLAPYYKGIQQNHKQIRKDIYAIHQLLRMVIYCPTVQQVSQQLKAYQIETFERETSVLKNGQNQQKVKSLLKKQFDYIKEYEAERLQIVKNTINTKPIYKQLQFEQQKIAPQNIQPQNYNVNTSAPSSRINNSSRNPFAQTTQNVMASSNQSRKQNKKQNKSVLIDLANSVSFIYKVQTSKEQIGKNKKSSKMKFKKQSDKAEDTIANNLKKNIIKNTTHTHIKPADSMNIPLFKSPTTQNQPNELSESDFRKLLYNAFAKNQGFSKTDAILTVPNTPTGNATAPNFTNFLSTSSTTKAGKKNNGYSSSLTQFIGRKQQEQQMECMQKLQKETYNKQLLNGEFIKNELYEEIKVGIAMIYPSFGEVNGLADSLVGFKHMNSLCPEDKQISTQPPQGVKNQKQSRIKNNVIEQNSTKFNQSGLIRNEKYNKSIKNELINHRQSYLRNVESENLSKMHLAQTSKLKRNSFRNECNKNIKQYYQQQLKRHLCRRQSAQISTIQ